ncbi:hypothetical protein FACS1894120_6750 [Clostridia bacterium]|nr:hypothetical protein FACS1894120_6750 [Clostridia bacterium]
MGFGKISNTFVDIVSVDSKTDSEGFAVAGDNIIASVRAYKENKHGTEKWANLASFSGANALFRFRKIPDVEVTTDMFLVCADGRFNILSSENVRGKNMYVEILAEKINEGSG